MKIVPFSCTFLLSIYASRCKIMFSFYIFTLDLPKELCRSFLVLAILFYGRLGSVCSFSFSFLSPLLLSVKVRYTS